MSPYPHLRQLSGINPSGSGHVSRGVSVKGSRGAQTPIRLFNVQLFLECRYLGTAYTVNPEWTWDNNVGPSPMILRSVIPGSVKKKAGVIAAMRCQSMDQEDAFINLDILRHPISGSSATSRYRLFRVKLLIILQKRIADELIGCAFR